MALLPLLTGGRPALAETLSPPERPAQYRLIDNGLGYELLERPRVDYQIGDFDEAHLAIHSCQDEPRGGPWTYNWAARRHPCTIVSGDLPRFALMRTYPEPTVAPAFHKMADARLCVTAGGERLWLDEASSVKAQFFPGGTVHRINLNPRLPLTLEVTAFEARNCGLGIEVAVSAGADLTTGTLLEYFVGGMDSKGPNFIPPYLLADEREALNDQITIEAGRVVLSDPALPDHAQLTSTPAGNRTLFTQPGHPMDHRLLIQHPLNAGGAVQHFAFMLSQLDPALAPAPEAAHSAQWRDEARQYYARRLEPFRLQTPDPALDAAFLAALVNLEYTFQPPAWLEGIHEWNSYYCNNYQISSAIDLGQMERARDALLLFGTAPGGPAPVAFASGPSGDPAFEDGLPYYIVQLERYWQATGDRETLDQIWKATSENLERMLKKRDPDGDLLLNWHQGCNAFLYQTDHLGQPGAAPSPTFMAVGNLRAMARLAEARGEADPAGRWRRRADLMAEAAWHRLWRPAEGRLATIDPQGLTQATNYYTDFVFPILYGDATAERGWILLQALDNTLWVGDHLMRSGNLKPPLFGNDMMGPVQMAEAAEAYAAAGRGARAWALLHGVALAATTHTNSPGAFPEYLTRTGYGQADWLFSNPAAAFVHGVSAGLFGFERRPAPAPALWHPALPSDWPEASLKLDGVTLSVAGETGRRRYQASFQQAQALACRLPLEGRQVTAVTDASGQALDYTIEPHPGGGFIHLERPAATTHEIIVQSQPLPAPATAWTIGPDGAWSWDLPAPEMAVDDPQGVFTEFRIEGQRMTGTLSALSGSRIFFLIDRQAQCIRPIDLGPAMEQAASTRTLVLKGPRQALDLGERYNTESFNGRNVWRFGERKIDLGGQVTATDGRTMLVVGPTRFWVRPTGRNILGLELGGLDGMTTEFYSTGRPWQASLPAGRNAVQGVELLTACEVAARLTEMAVGEVALRYHDGYVQHEPLVYGRNIDCFTESFAREVTVRKLGPVAHLAALTVRADPQRILDQVDVSVTVPEAFVGILGANLVLTE